MKKLILATLMLVSFLSGCGKNIVRPNENKSNTSGALDMETIDFDKEKNTVSFSGNESIQNNTDLIEFESGIYYNKNWDETDCYYKGATVPDEKTALEIAKAISNGMEGNKVVQKYVPYKVFFDEQDEIWIVHFCIDTNERIVGGGYCIAIQKQDGKVLQIRLSE